MNKIIIIALYSSHHLAVNVAPRLKGKSYHPKKNIPFFGVSLFHHYIVHRMPGPVTVVVFMAVHHQLKIYKHCNGDDDDEEITSTE